MPMPLRSRIEFGALGQYAVRAGDKDAIQRSRNVRDAVKRGDVILFDRGVRHLAHHPDAASIRAMFGPEVILVPAPGSAPQKDKALWVPQLICEALVRAGLAAGSYPWLRRTHAVPKSAFAPLGERPNALTHFDSITAAGDLVAPTRIVVVDDVVTRGCTLLAGVSRLSEIYPHAYIQGFAFLRAVSSGDIDRIETSRTGHIDLNADGSTRRDP